MGELPKRARIFVPEDAAQIKGCVQIIHGMAEHQGRYVPVAEFLKANGFVVVTSDLRGHGDNVETDDDSTNATNKTNTTTNGSENNTVIVNKNNTANAANNTNSNNATNKSNSANQATTNHPKTGEFMNGKVIAGVSIATFALIIAFAKLKKYNY